LLRALVLPGPRGSRGRRDDDHLRARVRVERRARERLRLPVPPGGETARPPSRNLRRRRPRASGGMTIYPAIDLRGGRCVRLMQGAFDRETVYGDDPVAVALRWEAEGAAWLHVVH